MKRSSRTWLQLGFAIACVYLGVAIARSCTLPVRLLDEQRGKLQEVVVHHVPGAKFAEDVYREFFARLPDDVRIWVVVERSEDAADFERLVGRSAKPVIVGRPITPWSRDRFASGACRRLLVPPRPHAGGERRANDALAPFALAYTAGATTVRAPFQFDGGDFCATDGRVLATSTWAARNPQFTTEQLVEAAEHTFGQPVVYLGDAPDHHIGMVLAPIGSRRILVGDARWGARLAPRTLDADTSERIASRFDAVAEKLARSGFQVDRIPVVSTMRDYVWVSYTNAILEDRTVYLPTYGMKTLDDAAAEVYRAHGFEVRTVDVCGTYEHGGALRCLVHVLARGGGSRLPDSRGQ